MDGGGGGVDGGVYKGRKAESNGVINITEWGPYYRNFGLYFVHPNS